MGRFREETAQILGSLIVSVISVFALKREKQRARPPFMLVANEVHNFVHGGRQRLSIICSRLSGGKDRKQHRAPTSSGQIARKTEVGQRAQRTNYVQNRAPVLPSEDKLMKINNL
jgi:hypothetical protein